MDTDTGTNGTGAKRGPKTGESKSDRFRRIAAQRVNDIIRTLDAIASMADKGVNEYNDTQIDKMEKAIQAGLNRAMDSLRKGAPPKVAEFKL